MSNDIIRAHILEQSNVLHSNMYINEILQNQCTLILKYVGKHIMEKKSMRRVGCEPCSYLILIKDELLNIVLL